MKFLSILGRQPELALAELESVLGPGKIKPAGRFACLVDEQIDINKFGGQIKVAEVLEIAENSHWKNDLGKVSERLITTKYSRKNKINIGLSVYGGRVSAGEVQKTILGIKKKLRNKQFSIRAIPNRASELNAAQVTYNKLLSEKGLELIVVLDGKKAFFAKTLAVQDIDAYTKRDRQKPIRDPLVGMLPPKLAQQLINLTQFKSNNTVLDPFCGTGTLLMEAQLMELDVYGSDIAPNMVKASTQNLEWLATFSDSTDVLIEEADARKHHWTGQFDVVASETYLGPPLRELPDKTILNQLMSKVDDLHRDFLHNMAAQLRKGQRMALAVPAWQTKSHSLLHLPVLDDLEKLGYNRASFEHTTNELVYRRVNQIVAREILVLIRK
jgi:tRNA G10  N-methylase Trm11